MTVIRVLAKTEADGRIRLTIPGGEPGTLYDVAVVLAPHTPIRPTKTPEELGWPPGFFENVIGSIDDDTFQVHPQPPLPAPPEPVA